MEVTVSTRNGSSDQQVLSWLRVLFLTGLDRMLLKVLLESIPVRMGL